MVFSGTKGAQIMQATRTCCSTGAWLAGALVIVTGLGGCAYNAEFTPAYLEEARHPAAERAEGKVLVYTTRADDEYVYSGSPTSFTGGGSTLTLPLGRITREAAKAAFADAFAGGAEHVPELAAQPDGRLIVSPKVTGFSYEYNQLKNLGFAVTPSVNVTLRMRVLDATGRSTWERTYDSGQVEGTSWMIMPTPTESMGRLTHKVIYDLLARSAADIAREVPRSR